MARPYGFGEAALLLDLDIERGFGAVGKSSKKPDLCRKSGDFWIPPLGGPESVALKLALRGGGGG